MKRRLLREGRNIQQQQTAEKARYKLLERRAVAGRGGLTVLGKGGAAL